MTEWMSVRSLKSKMPPVHQSYFKIRQLSHFHLIDCFDHYLWLTSWRNDELKCSSHHMKGLISSVFRGVIWCHTSPSAFTEAFPVGGDPGRALCCDLVFPLNQVLSSGPTSAFPRQFCSHWPFSLYEQVLLLIGSLWRQCVVVCLWISYSSLWISELLTTEPDILGPRTSSFLLAIFAIPVSSSCESWCGRMNFMLP